MGRNSRLKRERRAERERQEFLHEKKREQLLNLICSNEALYAMRRAMLRNGAGKNSCIMAARMFIEMAERMGYTAFGMTVETSVINEDLWDWINANGFGEEQFSQLPTADVVRSVPEGGRMVILGARDQPEPIKPGNWPGHMVAVVGSPNNWRVVDLSLDQATRTEKQIICRPSCFVVPDEWLEGTLVARGFRPMFRPDDRRKNVVVVECQAFPEDKSYESTPDWNRTYNATLTTNERGIQFSMDKLS